MLQEYLHSRQEIYFVGRHYILNSPPSHRENHSIMGQKMRKSGGMVKNRRLARSISDMGFSEIGRQLEYKMARIGSKLVTADRFFPSSKTCSNCQHVLSDLPLSIRKWDCRICGTSHDRDVNAAKNLAAYAVSSTVNACGGSSSGRMDVPCGETAPMKQEVNINIYL